MDVNTAISQAVANLPSQSHEIWVGYSGGLDSTVLLYALKQALAPTSLQLVALHIHHGLSQYADVWVQHCQATATAWNIPFYLNYVNAQPARGQSPEAAAREARYASFKTYSTADRIFMLGQHANDQAETLLLQLLRGAGLPGLAAMPVSMQMAKSLLIRPFLGVTRQQLLEYAQEQGLTWIEDDSNTHLHFDRNYLRHQVLPVLQQRWPAAIACINRSAAHSAEANCLLKEIAATDLLAVQIAGSFILHIPALQALTPLRLNNVIRYWLTQQEFSAPSAIKLQTCIQDVIHSRYDAAPCISWPGVEVRRFGDKLYAMPPLPKHEASWQTEWDLQADLVLPSNLGVLRREDYATLATGKTLTVKFREGGERLYNRQAQCHQTLKNKLQEWQVPPWLRNRIPLIFKNAELVAVAGYYKM